MRNHWTEIEKYFLEDRRQNTMQVIYNKELIFFRELQMDEDSVLFVLHIFRSVLQDCFWICRSKLIMEKFNKIS